MDNNENVINKTVNPKTINLHEASELIWRALRKGALNGSYDIDESYLIKVAYTKILAKIKETEEVITKKI